jgi:methyltransferase (TIGR00027 family)
MTSPHGEPLVRGISDTARWVAVYRARETEREDALFRDPFARRLAGERGRAIAERMDEALSSPWAFTSRTLLFDRLIERCVAAGADTVVNLAAGMDARPYRLTLPPGLRWIEVDLPGILDEKEALLAGEKPACRVERVRLDLSDRGARRAAFERIGTRSTSALVFCEGLLIYLTPAEVGALARDLHERPSFRAWAVDLSSPGLLRMVQRTYMTRLEDAQVRMHFGPPEGPRFFEPFGWTSVEVGSLLKTAARNGRLRFMMRLLALLPESSGRQGARPWSGVCLLERKERDFSGRPAVDSSESMRPGSSD